MNLFKIPTSSLQLQRGIRSFSFIHQNSANVLSKRKSTNFLFKRLKSNDSATSKTADGAKVEKVKLRASDLKRLLSLAKTEKWKITGELLTQNSQSESFVIICFTSGAIGCLIISSSITMAVPFGLGKILDIIYASETVTDVGVAKEKLDQYVP